MKLFKHVFSIGAALALVGCGSGGGGGAPPYIDVGYSGPTTTVTITSTATVGSLVTAANGGVVTFAGLGGHERRSRRERGARGHRQGRPRGPLEASRRRRHGRLRGH